MKLNWSISVATQSHFCRCRSSLALRFRHPRRQNHCPHQPQLSTTSEPSSLPNADVPCCTSTRLPTVAFASASRTLASPSAHTAWDQRSQPPLTASTTRDQSQISSHIRGAVPADLRREIHACVWWVQRSIRTESGGPLVTMRRTCGGAWSAVRYNEACTIGSWQAIVIRKERSPRDLNATAINMRCGCARAVQVRRVAGADVRDAPGERPGRRGPSTWNGA